CQQGNEHPYSF
nr:immunoglobulin light chain junction region [Macaca mulatta]